MVAELVPDQDEEHGVPRDLLALEQAYSTAELTCLLAHPIYYGVGVPRGDRHRVLLLPGFLGSDGYLSLLASWLVRAGYRPAQAGIAFNIGSVPALLRQIERRAEALAAEGRPITLIGHSLGGMFARVIAVRRPELIERVVTLGSPLSVEARRSTNPAIESLARALLHDEEALIEGLGTPLPSGVRLTSLYSRQDAVVHWRACIDDDPQAVNVEVRGSHTGLAWNAEVYRHLGRLLLM